MFRPRGQHCWRVRAAQDRLPNLIRPASPRVLLPKLKVSIRCCSLKKGKSEGWARLVNMRLRPPKKRFAMRISKSTKPTQSRLAPTSAAESATLVQSNASIQSSLRAVHEAFLHSLLFRFLQIWRPGTFRSEMEQRGQTLRPQRPARLAIMQSAITPMSMAGFGSMRALSTRNDTPELASRPFDLDRDGFVLGEGAGILILEELEFAKRRGARIYAEVVGYGMTADAYHMTAPDATQSGVIRAMQRAIADAGIQPEEIGYINAHGT